MNINTIEKTRTQFSIRWYVSLVLGIAVCASLYYIQIGMGGKKILESTILNLFLVAPLLILKPFVSSNSNATKEIVKAIDASTSIEFSSQAACLALNPTRAPKSSLIKFQAYQYVWAAISAYILCSGALLLLGMLKIVN